MSRAAIVAVGRVRFGSAMKAAGVLVALLTAGCASLSGGPPRLFSVDEEIAVIRNGLGTLERPPPDEASRKSYRNNLIAARMYAIDIQYTAYESALTRERQNVGFGAAATTIGLTTASGLVTPTLTKDVLSGIAGFVTGARAAYDNDILFAHSVQWIQSQMRARRADIARRILDGTRLSTDQYPIAAALSDLEQYYRAGTFTGGLIATGEVVAADSQLAEQLKNARVEFAFVATAAGTALSRCAVRPGAKAEILNLLPGPPGRRDQLFFALQSGQSPRMAEDVLARMQSKGFCL
jgi:hypothetical protein